MKCKLVSIPIGRIGFGDALWNTFNCNFLSPVYTQKNKTKKPIPCVRAQHSRHHTRTSHFSVVVVWVLRLLTGGGRTSRVSAALLMNPSGLDTLSPGQPLDRLAAITYSRNQSSRRPRNHSSPPVKSCRVLFPPSHSNTTPAATAWFLCVHVEVFHNGFCLYNEHLNQKSAKVMHVQ